MLALEWLCNEDEDIVAETLKVVALLATNPDGNYIWAIKRIGTSTRTALA
jgi:hypothetical protein